MGVLLAACRVHRPSLRYSNRGSLQMSDTAERVKKIVVEHLGVDESKVTDNASFIDDLGADSLDTVELVMAFEEEFGSPSRMPSAILRSTVSPRRGPAGLGRSVLGRALLRLGRASLGMR